MKQDKVVVGITMGDPNGIGPELIINAFGESRMAHMFVPVIYGSGKALAFWRNLLKAERFGYQLIAHPDQAVVKRPNFIECSPNFERVDVGRPTPGAGYAAFEALEKAVGHLKEGKLDALVTLPIDKSTIQNKDFDFPGHTEYLARRLGAKEVVLTMVHDELRVALVTGHVPLREAPKYVSASRISAKLRVLTECLKMDFGIVKPKIAVLGLNPHAGDNGLLGSEDKEHIARAVDEVRASGVPVYGPFPADAFFSFGKYKKFDAVLAMYHDQGLIPFKTLSQNMGVNMTAGLPAVRTSPDHGVAYDIAGRNKADSTSFFNAIFLAIDVFRRRTENAALYAGALKKPTVAAALLAAEDEYVAE
ncbi:MAG: 4-hydroxythreonine-4-phosphate dehydrogenase PdxA [Bacteroidia bacterium]|nr:4-hydroxythreonine-4-phosphate dehydrogenase PdxA [Bacteroidia bacterium]